MARKLLLLSLLLELRKPNEGMPLLVKLMEDLRFWETQSEVSEPCPEGFQPPGASET